MPENLRGLAEDLAAKMRDIGERLCPDDFECDDGLLADIVEQLLMDGAIRIGSWTD